MFRPSPGAAGPPYPYAGTDAASSGDVLDCESGGLGNVYASPVGAAGRIYLTARDGVTVAIADGEELKVLATSSVGEPVDATPALPGKDVYIRGEKHLFAIH